MSEISSASKLVDLLAQAGLLKAEERSEAVNMSRQTGLDITKLLTMHGYVSERLIKVGQEAGRRLSRDDALQRYKASEALPTWDQALERLLKQAGEEAQSRLR